MGAGGFAGGRLLIVVAGALFASHAAGQPAPAGGAALGMPQGKPGSAPAGMSPIYAGPRQGAAALLEALSAWERQDLGVPAPRTLHPGVTHAPTPNEIPGGQLITTRELVPMIQNPQGGSVLIFDVLGGAQRLPNAIPAVTASASGTFDDPPQRQLAQLLERKTRGRRDQPLVFYCQGRQCWMSYNAALRAINLGYTKVLWYRGGLDAWQRAGLPFATDSQPTSPQTSGDTAQPRTSR